MFPLILASVVGPALAPGHPVERQSARRQRRPYLLVLVLMSSLLPLRTAAETAAAAPAAAAPAGWSLVWSDEFDRPGAPDPAKWSYDVGDSGWGNDELQFYTDNRRENARVEDGHLVLEARREPFGKREYTSARLVTKGKGDWTYGRFEIRARLPSGRGTWPALWMLPTKWDLGDGSWPGVGEIDIMEHVGYDPGVIHASTHSLRYNWRQKTQHTGKILVPTAQKAFHTYVLEWERDRIRVLVDHKPFFTARRDSDDWEAWPFFRDFHLVLNIAVGGHWGGVQGVDPAVFPQQMLIDYVRVYQRPPAAKP